MAKAFFLTEDDRNDIAALLAAFRGGRLSIRGNPRRLIDKPGVSPETYLALATTGIPALTSSGTGSGTFSDSDLPGSAECQIYQVVDGELLDTGNTETVYNNSRSDITADWIQIHRDKFGTWWAIPSVVSNVQIVVAFPSNEGTGTDHVGYALVGESPEFDIQYADSSEETVTAYIRKGMVILVEDRSYYLVRTGLTDSDYEVLDPDLEFMGYTNTSATKGTTVNVQVWRGSPQAIFVYTGEDLLVSDNYGDIDAGSLVRCRWIDGNAWEIVNAECSVSGTGT